FRAEPKGEGRRAGGERPGRARPRALAAAGRRPDGHRDAGPRRHRGDAGDPPRRPRLCGDRPQRLRLPGACAGGAVRGRRRLRSQEPPARGPGARDRGRPPARRRLGCLTEDRAALRPGSFAFVMATGIVSVAAAQNGRGALSWTLFALAASAYGALLALALVRGSDLRRIEAWTVVAAAAVLGARLGLAADWAAAAALWLLAAASWIVLLPGAVPDLARRTARRRGSAFLAVVALESLAIAAAMLETRFPSWSLEPLAETLWAGGLVAYVLLLPGVGRRLLLGSRLLPDDWIAMGALGRSTSALVLWALASGWLPLLAWLELRRGARRYDPRRWSTVFPLGMYAAATHATGVLEASSALRVLAQAAFWLALAAWALAALGLVQSVRGA